MISSGTYYITPTSSPLPTVTPTPTPTPPGFEALFGVAGLLAVAYLLRRSIMRSYVDNYNCKNGSIINKSAEESKFQRIIKKDKKQLKKPTLITIIIEFAKFMLGL